jgi:hypothetical protein
MAYDVDDVNQHIKQNISQRSTIPNSQLVNSATNNLVSTEFKTNWKRSQKSLFTTNEDFNNSNSKFSKITNNVYYVGSDQDEEERKPSWFSDKKKPQENVKPLEGREFVNKR